MEVASGFQDLNGTILRMSFEYVSYLLLENLYALNIHYILVHVHFHSVKSKNHSLIVS